MGDDPVLVPPGLATPGATVSVGATASAVPDANDARAEALAPNGDGSHGFPPAPKYRFQGRALESVGQSLEVWLEIGNQVNAASSYSQLGVLHRLLGDLGNFFAALAQGKNPAPPPVCRSPWSSWRRSC